MSEDIKIPKHKLIMLATLFPFVEPSFFTVIHPIHTLYKGMLVACTVFLVLGYFAEKIFPSVVTILFATFMAEMAIACTITSGNIGSTANMYLPYMGIIIWFDIFCRKHMKDMLDVVQFLFDVYIVIDFISLIAFPHGMFTTRTYQAIAYQCWFLGHKNVQTRFMIQYMAISSVRDYMNHKKLQTLTYIRIALAILAVIRLESKTGLVGTVAYVALVILFLSQRFDAIKVWILKLCNIRVVFILSAVMSVLLIVFHLQNVFSFLIVDILHKSLTLSNRVYIWDKCINVMQQNWVLGYGVVKAELSREMIGASHAHNYFLNAIYNSGIVGMGLLTSIWFYSSYKIKKHIGNQSVRLLMFMAVVFLVMGIAEALTYTSLLYPVLLLLERSDLVEAACKEKTVEIQKKAEPITKSKVKASA